MKIAGCSNRIGSLVVTAALSMSMASASLFAQDGAKQDMKSAGHETKGAAVDAGHGVSTGTKKAYHKTKHVTKKAVHATGHGLAKVGDKMAGKPAPQQ